jgi:hypothetical protein
VNRSRVRRQARPTLLAVEAFVGHFERARYLPAQDNDVHVWDFAGLCCVNELQCVAGA